MRLVVATVSMLVGAAMLLPAGTALPAFAQIAPSASVAPSASAEPSASLLQSGPPSDPCMMVDPDLPECHDAEVFVTVDSATEPVRDWAIAVTGGVPNQDVLTVPDPRDGAILITLTMSGESAIVELTATLPAGSRLISGRCFEMSDEVRFDVLVPPRRLVLGVVRGGAYECSYRSDVEGAPAPTAPPTDSLAGAETGSSSGGWQMVLALMAAVIAASLLIAARARLQRSA